uniref:Uncharacterized protein n=1 Tax=Oryza brachyantha TaxID=4533 RepID=J3LC13_ORYBR
MAGSNYLKMSRVFVPLIGFQDQIWINKYELRVDQGETGATVTQYHHYNHYCEGIFFASIDSIMTGITHRFNDVSMELLVHFSCLDPTNNFCKFDEVKLARLTEIYAEDFSMDYCVVIKHEHQN